MFRLFFFFKQKTAYEMRISDWSSDVCSSDLDKAHDELSGLSDSGTVERNPAKILEQHRFLDLDDDGVPEPYIVWVDATTEKVLRIAIRYDTDRSEERRAGKECVSTCSYRLLHDH